MGRLAGFLRLEICGAADRRKNEDQLDKVFRFSEHVRAMDTVQPSRGTRALRPYLLLHTNRNSSPPLLVAVVTPVRP